MNKRILWPFVAILLLSLPLTGCDGKVTIIHQGNEVYDLDLPEKIAQLNIKTKLNNETGVPTEVNSKQQYVSASMSINSLGEFTDQSDMNIKIRRRGNSTFDQPKPPYKIKINKNNDNILGLPSGSDYLLIANYFDGSLMANALAFKIGRILKMPFTNNIVPVELVLNDDYKGMYLLTTHKEIGEGRIDVGKDGVLIELTQSKSFIDNKFSKYNYIFQSQSYMLPVYIRYPSINKIAVKDELGAENVYSHIKNDFNELDALIGSGDFPKKYGELLNKKSIAQLLLVHQLTRNGEINHPKSIYMYKSKDGKYNFGPIWDFDWAYGGSSKREFFQHAYNDTVLGGSQPGGIYFKRFLEDPEVFSIFKREWELFRAGGLKELIGYMEAYYKLIKNTGAYNRDYDRWHEEQNKMKDTPRKLIEEYIYDMKIWIEKRAIFIDEFVQIWEKNLVKTSEPEFEIAEDADHIVTNGAYDIYITDNKIIYISNKCTVPAQETKFFLHFTPLSNDEIPENRRGYGFDNHDFSFEENGIRKGDSCLIERDVPAYGIKNINTGQFSSQGIVWSKQIEIN